MITDYNKYIEVNEAFNLFGSLKNLFGKLMQNVNDELKKPIDALSNNLNKTKDPEKMKKEIGVYLKTHQEGLNKSLDEVKELNSIPAIVNDNLIAIYASINASIKFLGEDTYTFDEIFKDSPAQIKKLFNKNEKNFTKNVENFSNELVLSLGKQFKVSKEDLVSKKINDSMIYEADETEPSNLTDNDQETIVNSDTTEEIKDVVNDASKRNEKVVNLTGAIKKWFEMTLYKTIKEEIIEVKKESTKVVNPIENLSDEITKNKNNVKGMLDKFITSIKDKNELVELRDYLSGKGYGVKDFKF